MNPDWVRDLIDAVRQAHTDPEARVVVLRGAGRAFCTGADLKEAPTAQDLVTYRDIYVNPQQDIARSVRRLEKPVLAQVHGYAVGGGCELTMPAEQLASSVRALAEQIAERFPLELALMRSSLYRATDLDFDAAAGDEARAALLSFTGGARTHGMAAAMDRIRQRKEQAGPQVEPSRGQR